MLLVKSIDIIEVNQNRIDLAISNFSHTVPYTDRDGVTDSIDIDYIKEVVTGEKFMLPNGKIVYIGLSEQTRQALMLPLGAYTDLQARYVDIQNMLNETKEELAKAKSFGEHMTLQERINFLGTGKI